MRFKEVNYTWWVAAVVLAIGIAAACLTVGCNTDQIAATTRQIFDADADIEAIEQGLVADKSKLKMIPLTDLARADLERRIEQETARLKLLQAKKGRLVKERDDAVAEDDELFGEVQKAAVSVTPLGFGGLVTTGLLLIRGFLKNRSFKNIVQSVQPLIDDATPKQKEAVTAAQTPAAGRLVKGLKGEKKMLPI